jgi:hypothetical protein
MTTAAELLQQAEQLARSATTWADLSNALFDPLTGLLARAYPARPEREAFIKTAEYREIQRLLAEATERFGLVEGATPTRVSGLMVPAPQGWPTAPEAETLGR